MSSLRYAWRNLFRNRRRTAITVIAVALNTAILIASFALMDGFIEQSIHNATHLVVGDAQVHAPGYLSDRSMYKHIPRPEDMLEVARRHGVLAAPRSFGFGLVSSGPKSAGASFWGVDPRAERGALKLASSLLSGRFVADEADGGVIIGHKLAKSLRAKEGSEIVAVVQAADGSLGNELYEVVGILKTVGEDIDRGAVLMHRKDFDELFVAGGRVHEIALNAQGKMSPAAVAGLYHGVADGKIEARTWRELLPMLNDMLNLSDASMAIFATIFLLAAGLGVLNTTLMATHDRVREYGVLKALGATPGRIVFDVLAEATLLSLLSTGLGTVIGIAGCIYLQTHGIDLTQLEGGSMTFSGIAFDPVWRAALTFDSVTNSVIAMCITCVLASLYPAIKAARLDPVKAMTHV